MKHDLGPNQTYRRLRDDFVLGHCRIADRRDLKVELEPNGMLSVAFEGKPDLGPDERHLFLLLAAIVAHSQFTREERYLFRRVTRSVGKAFQEIRESLRLSEDDIAEYLHTTRPILANWESGTDFPGLSSVYYWCRALGLVCPPNTALVRTVEFSPDILRFLQEDPTRLISLTPDQFERFVAEHLDRMGYNVKLTGGTNRKDGGIDLIAVPKAANLGSVVIAGQMKHHRDRKTEREAVDRLLSWKDTYFGVGLLVTNTAFTRDALWTAQQERNRHFLRLRDFIDLKRWLEGQFGDEKDWREIPDRIELAPGVVVEIPKPRITTNLDSGFFEEK